VDGDRLALDLAAWPALETWAQRPALGRPLCHYVAVRGIEAEADAVVVRLASGLLGPG
jgi:hypothetical protein